MDWIIPSWGVLPKVVKIEMDKSSPEAASARVLGGIRTPPQTPAV
jgi:hypothetical protein